MERTTDVIDGLVIGVTMIIETISIGPVTDSDVMAMANLTRDYHPYRVIGAVARSAGHSKDGPA